MKFSALTLAAVSVMALGVSARPQDKPADNSTDAPAGGNGTNTTAPGGNGTAGNSTGNSTSGAPKPTGSSAAFAIAAGSEGIVAAGVFAGLLAALV